MVAQRNKDSGFSNPLLVIIGPTGVGKTALSLQIARMFAGEVVSADSRLFYRGLDIGTDKPSIESQEDIRHHLIDICEPDETLTLGEYQRLAYEAIANIQKRKHLPLLVGGTGQYVKAVVEGWGIPAVPPNEALRHNLADLGGPELNRWLNVLDPPSAERIDARNVRRTIRALEVTLSKGKPMSELQKKNPPDFSINQIGLTGDRAALYRRVDLRIEDMMARGLLDEVSNLKSRGFDDSLPSMSGLGYRQLLSYLDGQSTLEEAIERIKFETHRYIRQQYTWFRLDDPEITWFDVEKSNWEGNVIEVVRRWMGSRTQG